MGRFNNAKKNKFLKTVPQSDIETSNIATRCKFNFSYFDANQPAGQDFSDWDSDSGLNSLATLLNKVKDYTREPLSYWREQRVGGGGLKVLAYYGAFPKKSDFTPPPNVPHDVSWARFRLGNKVRLIGFVIPEKFSNKDSSRDSNKYYYDCNTFYVVFLDREHVFYKTEQK
ncbi:MAG: hypothetical protein GQ569_09765 [Methylococcaceae bacterium]|nr:hypothetical protein [Methylococcaceae bacterium]